jgi:CrcB protein
MVGTGGLLGAIARYVLSGLVHRIFDGRFPYGTLMVNILGCFLIGLIMYWVNYRGLFSPNLRIFLIVGILGSFTTFSAFAYESLEMLLDQRILAAFSNILLHLVVCIGAVWAAMMVGQLITK